MDALGTAERPLRVAIIGAGPAGFYGAEALLKRADLNVTIDIINRFPTPFGLVRDGVAPDHQSIKAVIRVFDKLLADPRVRFLGNVTYGRELHHDDLKAHYDQIVYAVGAQADRRMGIAGEDLPNSLPATAFVGWYNGHPDYRDLALNLDAERAVVVGNGNVAMDVTRILVTPPEELAKSDIADHALERLRHSRIREVVLLGRRGAAQAAFTTPEIKEFGKIPGVDVVVDPANIALDPASVNALADDRTAAANMEILREYAARPTPSQERRIIMRFLASPKEILSADGQIRALVIERNELVVDENGGQRARGTGEFEMIDCGLILRSIGYKSVPIEAVPFDSATATFSNVAGRIINPNSGETHVGEYVVGWAKRGPTGLIGNNKPDSAATVESMLADLPTLPGIDDARRDPHQIVVLLQQRGVDIITYQDWKKLEAYENDRGETQGRPRVKTTSVAEMLAVIRGA